MAYTAFFHASQDFSQRSYGRIDRSLSRLHAHPGLERRIESPFSSAALRFLAWEFEHNSRRI
jgi:hypothetical protein